VEQAAQQLVAEAVDRLRAAAQILGANSSEFTDSDAWTAARAELGQEIAGLDTILNNVSATFGLASASDRLKHYFQMSRGKVVSKDQLRGVAGIEEWARRVRELREAGWQIESGVDSGVLQPYEYVFSGHRSNPADEL
jgi:hypothetical protein